MLLNIVLLFLVFGAAKKNFSPYGASAILGLVKGALYFLVTRNAVAAVVAAVVFGGLAALLVHFLARLDKREAAEDPYPTYGSRKKQSFKREWIPVSVAAVCLILGESFASLFIAR